MTTQRRRSGAEDDTIITVLPLIFMAIAALAGIPGIGLYVGLVAATLYVVSATKPREGVRVSRQPIPGQEFFTKLGGYAGHPFKAAVGTGSQTKWWPPVRISAAWAALCAGVLAFVPAAVHAAGIVFPKITHPLISPGLELVSFLGYFATIQAYLAAHRGDTPPVLLEWEKAKELGSKIAPAVVFGVSAAVVCFLCLGHAHQIFQLFDKKLGPGAGASTYAGLGTGGAIEASATLGLLIAAAISSAVYAAHYLKPHQERVESYMGWAERWRAVLPTTVPTPIFAGEIKLPEDSPTLCTAAFEVPPGATMDAYLKMGKALAPILRTEFVEVHPDWIKKEDGKPTPNALSPTVFQLSYPLVPVGAGAHASRAFTEPTPLFHSIVAFEFRRVFAELHLGQPVLVTLGILTTPESRGRIVETMWSLDIGTPYDAVAKASYQLADKLGVPWLKVGRRSSVSTAAGGYLAHNFVSILYGDHPDRATFASGKRLKAVDHERFVERVEWDSRFRDCGLSAGGATPTLLDRVVDERARLIDWTFAYPPGLQSSDVDSKLESLRAVPGSPGWILFRRDADATRFHLLTADTDPLSRIYEFMEWAPLILHEPVPGQARLRWVIGVGVNHQLVSFEFDTDAPHLLVAGETGFGKSMALSSMILQLAVANQPADLNLRLVDPKTELAIYTELEHVTHSVEVTAEGNLHERFCAVLADTLYEAQHRYALLTQAKEKKISDAKAKGKLTDIPYIVMVMDEVAMLLNPPTKGLAKTITSHITNLANMGRAAGIFLVMATQYPSNASVPNHLREQFSRIGFKVKDLAASRLVLEDSGLEKIVERGVGIARIRGEMTPFRGFLLQPGGPGTPADHDFILSHLPKKPDGSVLDAEGAFHPPDPVPVPPPGIWAS